MSFFKKFGSKSKKFKIIFLNPLFHYFFRLPLGSRMTDFSYNIKDKIAVSGHNTGYFRGNLGPIWQMPGLTCTLSPLEHFR